MAQLRNGMRAITLDPLTPAETVTKLNLLLEHYIDVPFATLAYLALDPDDARRDDRLGGAPAPARRRRPTGDAVPRGRRWASRSGVDAGRRLHRAHGAARGRARSSSSTRTGSSSAAAGRSTRGSTRSRARGGSQAPREPDAFVDALVGDAARRRGAAGRRRAARRRARPGAARAARADVPRGPRVAAELRRELERLARAAAVPELDARDILLATWEAGANAIEHSGATDGAVVRGGARRSRATGSGSGSSIAAGGRSPRCGTTAGLGLRLIEALMTNVDVERGHRRDARRDGAAAHARARRGRVERIQLRTDEIGGVRVVARRGRAGQARDRPARVGARPARRRRASSSSTSTGSRSSTAPGCTPCSGSSRLAAPVRTGSRSSCPTQPDGPRDRARPPRRRRAGAARRSRMRRSRCLAGFGATARPGSRLAKRREEGGHAASWRRRRDEASPAVRAHQGLARGARRERAAEEIAARTVNKERARSGEARESSRLSREDISSGRRGGIRANRKGPRGRTKAQLYEEAKDLGIEGRSKMTKAQLQRAVSRKRR